MTKICWDRDVLEHDFGAAEAFLSLRLDEARAFDATKELRRTKVTKRRANDILRACDREALPLDDPGVRRALEHVARGKRLSPILVVSYDFGADIADGYHRVSLAYHLDPFADVPLRMAAAKGTP